MRGHACVLGATPTGGWHADLALTLALLIGTLVVTATPLAAQSSDELVDNALSAAPGKLAAEAAVMDLEGNMLREASGSRTRDRT